MFLTKAELTELTGYKVATKQRATLIKNGIRFTVNRHGHPLVLKKHIEEILCNSPSPHRRTQPNEAALKKSLGLI